MRATWAYRIGVVAVAVAALAVALSTLVVLLYVLGMVRLSWLAFPLACLGFAVVLGWVGVIGQVALARRRTITMTDPAYALAILRLMGSDVWTLLTHRRFVVADE
jgi:hypothetical protein